MSPNELRRFEAKIEPEPMSGCWLWTAHLDKGGYSQMKHDGRRGRPEAGHRFAYKHWRGEIPEGLCIDHLCRVRACVNPWHLRVVTNRENVLAPGAQSFAKRNVDKTACPLGHSAWKVNGQRKRECTECRRLRRDTDHSREVVRLATRRYRERKRAQA